MNPTHGSTDALGERGQRSRLRRATSHLRPRPCLRVSSRGSTMKGSNGRRYHLTHRCSWNGCYRSFTLKGFPKLATEGDARATANLRNIGDERRTLQSLILTFFVWCGRVDEVRTSMKKGVAHRAFLDFAQTDVPDYSATCTVRQRAYVAFDWAAMGSPRQILSSLTITTGSWSPSSTGMALLTYGWFKRRRSGASIMESKEYI